MIGKQNAIQRFILRIAMMRAITGLFANKLHRIDGMVLKLTKGKHTLSEIVGWPIIQVTMIGAKTGETYTLPLLGLFDDDKIALIASSFGRQHNPGWYYNLREHPKCQVHLSGHTQTYIARETDGDEREKYWQMAVSYYKGYDAYKIRAAHRKIPVLVLEPG